MICLAGIAIKQIIVKLKDMKGGKRELKPKDIYLPHVILNYCTVNYGKYNGLNSK